MEIKEILQKEDTFKYQLLSRLQMDCNFYLGNGNRQTSKLWANTEKEHIQTMKEIWKSFADDEKPEWLTWDDILEYESKMVK